MVIKAFGGGIVHKSDIGAVRLDLDADEVPAAIFTMRARLAAEQIFPDGFLVEEQVVSGVELLVGAVRGPFGVTVTIGLGGVLAEVLDDVAVGLAPLDREEAEALLDSFRGAALLRGYRNTPEVNREALVALVLAIAGPDGVALDDDVVELDCNPVIATPKAVVVADARIVPRRARSTSTRCSHRGRSRSRVCRRASPGSATARSRRTAPSGGPTTSA
jgi:hypothetical protein